ncbi:MAG: glycosyl hydrolase, partial [Kiritimatiellaeota bacterium]|nr:glycosyl hydrolase [Kiritimatiellota bacterium]
FKGYSEEELAKIPRVTTETGVGIDGDVDEELQGLHLMNIYLSQFARGWSHTSVYLLRDRTDEGGNQTYGFYAPDYTPRKAAHNLHNLTTILNDKPSASQRPGTLAYTVENQTPTTHDLLLQHSSGKFQLVVWGEKARGSDDVVVRFAAPRDVKVYNPVSGVEPVETLSKVSEVKLAVSNHPYILVTP